jgi:hypothetical protein
MSRPTLLEFTKSFWVVFNLPVCTNKPEKGCLTLTDDFETETLYNSLFDDGT